jgi:nitroreductase
MRPQRRPFALDYIDETVHAYKTARKGAVNCLEISWATDVLDEYFNLHHGIEVVATTHQTYAGERDANAASGKLIPYRNATTPLPSIDIATLKELARKRRSVRWFLQQPVPRWMIDKAIDIGAQAPSACNRQAFVYRVFDDPVLVGKILSIPYGTAGFAHNVPVVTVVVGQQRHFFSERDRHLIYIDASLATMGVLLALEVQGLSSCCINWPDLADKEAQVARILQLDADERPIMLLAIGYADPEGLVPYSQKKSLDLLRRYNSE